MKDIKMLIKDEIVEMVNHLIREQGFLLIDPASVDQEHEEGLMWMANQSGKIILQNIDVFEHTKGYDLLKPDAPFGLNAYVANLCDALLIEAGVDLVPAENIQQ